MKYFSINGYTLFSFKRVDCLSFTLFYGSYKYSKISNYILLFSSGFAVVVLKRAIGAIDKKILKKKSQVHLGGLLVAKSMGNSKSPSPLELLSNPPLFSSIKLKYIILYRMFIIIISYKRRSSLR